MSDPIDKLSMPQVRAVHRSKTGHSCPLWVKSGNTQNEHILSALPPKADIDRRDAHLRFVPEADIRPSRSR